MDAVLRTPIVECFLRGDVSRDLRLIAAQGVMAEHARDQLALLVLLSRDPDQEVAATAAETTQRLPKAQLAAFLARPDVPADLRDAYAPLIVGVAPAAATDSDEPLPVGIPVPEVDPEAVAAEDDAAADVADPLAEAVANPDAPERRPISSLTVVERMKLATRGTREQRAVLIRDPNRLVAASVLGSPKLTETEIEAFARMGNVSEDVLRVIGSNRSWMKSYTLATSLVKNPKTPPVISVPLVNRLNERDLKGLVTDRNVPESIRLAARKLVAAAESRRR
jgi:hypothetical protein